MSDYDEAFASALTPTKSSDPYDAAFQSALPQATTSLTPSKKAEQNYSPTDGMSALDKLLAGTGKAMVDTARGIGQVFGVVNRGDVEESRRLDAPLMKSGYAKVGNFAGNVAMLAPTSLIPGSATIPGAALIGAGSGFLQPSTSTGETLLNTGIGAAGGAAGQYLGNLVGGKISGAASNRLQASTAAAAADAQRIGAAKSAMDKGYVIPPADLNPGMLTDALSGFSGKIKTAQTASQRNQAITDNLAKRSLGIPEDQPLTIDALNTIRRNAGAKYDAIANSGTITPGASYNKTLDDIAAPYLKAAQGFPNAKVNPVIGEIDGLRSNSFDAGSAIEKIKSLREDADMAYRAGDKSLGRARKAAADALEGAIDDHLVSIGAPANALKDFRDARQTIAKTYTVQKALNDQTGNVAAPVLASQLNKGKPLSGDLLSIAQMAQAFPKASQALKEAPKQFSPLDFAGAGISAAASQNLLPLLSLGARPLARSALLAGPYQQAALKQARPSAGLLGAFDSDLLQRLSAPMGIAGGLLAVDR